MRLGIRLLLFSIIFFLAGFSLAAYLISHNLVNRSEMLNYFSKPEIVQSHSSFDERLNLLEERVAILEDSKE